MQQINATNLPTPPPFLSQAVRTGNLVHCSGQIPVDDDGKLLTGPIGELTRRALDSLDSVLRAAGGSLTDAVRFTIYLTSMDDYAEMNATYAEVVQHAPARTCIAVAALPFGSPIEIECVAVIDPDGETR